MRILDAKAVQQALPYPKLIDAIAETFLADTHAPERLHYKIPRASGNDVTMIFMPAWQRDGHIGVKLVTVSPDNRLRSLPAISASYLLLDGDTGQPLLMIDGPELTARRTAAVSALAAQYLAPELCRTHLILGAGAVAGCVARSHRAVRRIEKTLVWARSMMKAKALCTELNSEGILAEPVEDLQTAVSESDLISTATLSAEPILLGGALRQEVHLDLIGSYLPDMREADDAAVAGAIIYADNPGGALKESGELSIPIASGVITPSALAGGLHDLVRQSSWRRPEGKTIFKSVGMAVSDFAAAQCVLKWLDAQHQ